MKRPPSGYISIHNVSKILDIGLEQLMSYIIGESLDLYVKNPSELKMYGFAKKNERGELLIVFDDTAENFMKKHAKNTGKVIEGDTERIVLSGYCLLKEFRRYNSQSIIANRLIILSENGSEEGTLESSRYISLENVFVKMDGLEQKRNQIEEFDANKLPDGKREIKLLDAQMRNDGLSQNERMHYLFEEGYTRLEIATHFELPLVAEVNKSKREITNCISTVRKGKCLEPKNWRVNKGLPLDRYIK